METHNGTQYRDNNFQPMAQKKDDIDLNIMNSNENKQTHHINTIDPQIFTNADTIANINVKDPNKCNLENCNKKLGLLDSTMKCKCGNTYCAKHRFSDKHNCSFDYKKEGREKIEKSLNKVVATKITPI
ncbi:AN1-like zinc finger protein [Fadolivirus algeromassiliense]|jgi:hypothetical protein|uniref:AN1-like zinc finger protein n=1 Tax=Fadolivirus FV1/VV64 TaxID=3070911 RepID=A0A7D3UVI6_9VIRU|nr:AN1-like zinc finger protein [Fadolivirus algeromassiliense]QKF94074.1 AN1-like zinc finger protein [Fadolivirus FV1/VV64]